ncbi:hypothetical protein BpHYR1_032731 [Brachionus plicatilis]|uniref:Uncharacterized protein n=1 Tax=Brachionus plicatilis TaxID=10195 RepID=A0A3M7P3I8_BRAPC|nr:hypothetical protein BpHYR1_032731 [Brachionus plicatilis]
MTFSAVQAFRIHCKKIHNASFKMVLAVRLGPVNQQASVLVFHDEKFKFVKKKFMGSLFFVSLKVLLKLSILTDTQICMPACYYLILPRIIQLKLLGNFNHWNTYLKPTKIYSKVKRLVCFLKAVRLNKKIKNFYFNVLNFLDIVFALINRKNKRSSQKTESYVLKRRV